MNRVAEPADQRLVHAAARRLGLQAAGIVALSVLVLAGLASLVVLHQQHAAANRTLRNATSTADDVGDPPAGTWLVLQTATGQQHRTPGLPAGFPDERALSEVGRSGIVQVRDANLDDREYRVRTARRPDGLVVQAVLDLQASHAEQARLLLALLSVGALGLLLAAVAGALLGRRAVRPLADALVRQREFVADASHELRTPLTLLSTRVQVLQRNARAASVGAALMHQVEAVTLDTRRMVELVEDLLLAADPAAGPADDCVDLGALCAEIADAARDYAAERDVRIAVNKPPPDVTALYVAGTQAALRRAVLAVLDNAIEHAPAGGTVTLTAERLGAEATLDVSDTGPGLAPGDVDRIFDRFHSGRQKAGRRSYGLGLSLARGVAEQFGGSLSVAHTNSAGSTFRFVFPRLEAGSTVAGP